MRKGFPRSYDENLDTSTSSEGESSLTPDLDLLNLRLPRYHDKTRSSTRRRRRILVKRSDDESYEPNLLDANPRILKSQTSRLKTKSPHRDEEVSNISLRQTSSLQCLSGKVYPTKYEHQVTFAETKYSSGEGVCGKSDSKLWRKGTPRIVRAIRQHSKKFISEDKQEETLRPKEDNSKSSVVVLYHNKLPAPPPPSSNEHQTRDSLSHHTVAPTPNPSIYPSRTTPDPSPCRSEEIRPPVIKVADKFLSSKPPLIRRKKTALRRQRRRNQDEVVRRDSLFHSTKNIVEENSAETREASRVERKTDSGHFGPTVKERCCPFDVPGCTAGQMAHRVNLVRQNSAAEPNPFVNGSHNLSYLMQHMQNHPPKDSVGDSRALVDINSDEAKRVFPFQATPSGNLKIIPNQVVFESKKVSVLVADPRHTKVNVKAELSRPGVDIGRTSTGVDVSRQDLPSGISHSTVNQQQSHQKSSHADQKDLYRPRTQPFRLKPQQQQHQGDMDQHQGNQATASHAMPTNDTPLAALGFTGEQPIDWENIILPEKTDLYQELARRITNYKNADCIIRLGHDEFHCHLLVLQSYSTFFDEKNYKEVDLTGSGVTSKAFSVIYDWMISPTCESCHLLRRDNILEIFTAAQYLGVKELEEQCWAFIDNDELFCEDTAFLLYLEARKIGNTAVMELMVPRIMKFFLMLVSTKDFLELSIDELCSLLKSNYICVNSEMEVLMSAVRWLMHDWEGRRQYLLEVLKCVRFGLIAPWQLVDVKRNPENPEFMELMSYPEVQKMVDDGLAFVIIKYWYGNQTEDYYHWIDLLGLTEPTNRNWAGEDKNYVTYREFLLYLEEYQRTRMPELKAPRKVNLKPAPPNSPPPKECPSPPPSRKRGNFPAQNYGVGDQGGSSGHVQNNGNNNPGNLSNVLKYPPPTNPPKIPVPTYLPPGTPASMMVPPEILSEYLTSLDRNSKEEQKNPDACVEAIPKTDIMQNNNFIEAGKPSSNLYNFQQNFTTGRKTLFDCTSPEGPVTEHQVQTQERQIYCYQKWEPNFVHPGNALQLVSPQNDKELHYPNKEKQRRQNNYDDEFAESSKSEEEAATTIQAVYKGYKARRRFNEIRKTSSEEQQKAKQVAELLALPVAKNLDKPLEPVKVSASFACHEKDTNKLPGLSPRRKRRDSLVRKNIERPSSQKDLEGLRFDAVISPQPTPRAIKKNRQIDLQAVKSFTSVRKIDNCTMQQQKPIQTIKSPAFFTRYDERLSSVTPSENTEIEDPFSPRIEGQSAIDLQTYSRELTATEGNFRDRPKPKARDIHSRDSSGLNSRFQEQMSVNLMQAKNYNQLREDSLFYPDHESVLIFGGIDPHEEYGCTGNTGKDMYRFKSNENAWEFVGEIPEPRHHHSVVYLRGRVYLVGGADPRDDYAVQPHKSIVVGTVWSYDPLTRIWYIEPSMLTPRKNFCLVVSEGKMFAIGGQDKNGIALRTVEAFDPLDSTWREMRPMFTARVGPACAKYQSRIWVAGGMTKSKKEPLSKEVECYDPSENLWLKAAPMLSPRCFASMSVVSDCLYVIGGAGNTSKTENMTESIASIDVWDQDTCSWRQQTKMVIARHGHSTGYIGDQILIIGGVTTAYMGTLKSVECYCCGRENWIKGVSPLPYAISGHGSVSLPPINLLAEH